MSRMPDVTPTDRWRGALLGTALGDAVGAPFEGWPRVSDRDVGRWLDADAALTWTDDTAMAIGLGRSLVACGGRVDLQHLGDTFAAAYGAEPWRGYGAGPPRIFTEARRRGRPYVEVAAGLFGGTGSFGNGGAMRAAPCAVVAAGDLDHAARLARRQALVTHAHELGADGAALQAMAVAVAATTPTDGLPGAVAGLVERVTTTEMRAAVEAVLDLDGDTAAEVVVPTVGNGIEAVQAVPAALAAFLGHPDDPVAAVTAAVCLGGDADTIAAMAGALAGAHAGATAVPEPLLERLEARTELVALADALADLAG